MAAPVFEKRWPEYYKAVAGRPPRETLLTALANFEREGTRQGFAVDLGCGDGRDTVELRRRGWPVLAIDAEAEALERLSQRSDIDPTGLETRLQRFEYLQLPESVDLINASFALPFCPPAEFPALWAKIVTALKPGGRFCGQLFGERDSWAVHPTITHFTRLQVETLLQPFTIELLDEEDHPGTTALGETKHWHLFNLVARKLRQAQT